MITFYKHFGTFDIEIYTNKDNSISVYMQAEGFAEDMHMHKDISREELKEMIDKLTEMYDAGK